MFNKSFFRKEFLWRRKQHSWDDSARCIGEHIERYFRQNLFDIVAFYYPIENEIDLRAVLMRLKKEGFIKILALPQISCGQMRFAPWEEGDCLAKDETGVPAPLCHSFVYPQCLLVPCLGMDLEGYRLGYGGGWYDKFLANANVKTIGVLSKEFLIPKLPHEVYDRPLSAYVNENGLSFVRPLE